MTTSPTTTAAPTITESRYAKLKAKLRELFELDKADLDFGIYRIMAAKNTEVTDFLDRQLKDVVRQTLTEHGAGQLDTIRTELDETIANLRENAVPGEQIETNAKVVGLRERLEAAGGKSGEELEADIYNHLLAFFGRYYDEGDFISQRRYKGDTYAIPYSGEEVTLHWANKDQYYIKSGEWHKDYRFRLPDGRRVRFALVDATQETGNNKEPDEAKRRYILVDDNPVVAEGDTLTLRFHFKAPSEAEKERADDDAVAIFSGKYEKSTKGDERERFCADAEKRAIPNIPEGWHKTVLAESATEAKPKRTLLGKHLDAFTARNTFDYFIHKDLGGFLRRELDFYIKNEVVRLDDLDAAPAGHLQRVQGRVKAIRAVASSVIGLLASIEDFQKKLWLKKKFVLNTSWLVTVDRVPQRLRDTIAENAEQWAEWERLGFKPEDDKAAGLFDGAKWGTRAYLDACDKLVVDTRLFDEAFSSELLASEEILAGCDSIYDATSGQLVNSENFAATRLLADSFSGMVQSIYLDPPYNTSASEIIYKNEYKHSSWLALMYDRLSQAQQLLGSLGMLCVTIDDFEFPGLVYSMESVFGSNSISGVIAIKNNPSGRATPKGFSIAHEYAVFASRSPGASVGRLGHSPEQVARYKESDEYGKFEWVNFRKHGGANANRSARPKLYYPIFVSESAVRIPTMEWDASAREWILQEEPNKDEVVVFPDDGGGAAKTWKWGSETARESIDELRPGIDQEARPAVYRKARLNDEGTLPRTVWDKSVYSSTAYGTNLLADVMGEKETFAFPKSVHAVSDCLIVAGVQQGSVVMDYFAGSGTSGHAVVNLNRRDGLGCRFILVEMGKYYDAVLRRRMAKVLYASDWKAGHAQIHDQGLSALVKCFAVESYEDALNNLPAPTGGMFDGRPAGEADALIRYALDLEMGPHLLDLDIFRDPWGHAINAQLAGDDEIRRHRVDLVETFNYLLGLRVSAYGPIERYSAQFERSEHDDGLGRLKLKGRLKRDPDGPFRFQRVEGILNDESNTRVLVVWRTLTDDPEEDAAVLDAWMARHRQETTERTEHRDYHQIFINGPVTLPQPTAEIRTVYPIEEAFKQKMFEGTDGVS